MANEIDLYELLGSEEEQAAYAAELQAATKAAREAQANATIEAEAEREAFHSKWLIEREHMAKRFARTRPHRERNVRYSRFD